MRLTLLAATLLAALFSSAQNNLTGDDLFGDLRARQIGPAVMSGRITDLEGHPTNPRVLWVGTAGGGVWKSENGGLSYLPVFDKHNQSIGAITLDPTNPDKVIWVGTGEVWTRNSVSVGDGIYKSNDGGQTWNKTGLEKSERISAIRVNPKKNNQVFVGVLGNLWGNSSDRGVYKTEDGGKSWEKIFYLNDSTGCSELIMDPSNPNTLYAAFWEFRRTAHSFSSGGSSSALYKSIDGGKTWNKIHNGFPAGKLGRIAIAAAPSKADLLYAVLECEKPQQKGLYRSEDGGANWKHLNADFELSVRPFYFSRIVIDPKNPDIIAKAGLNGAFSRDGGKTFRSFSGIHADVHDIWFGVQNSDEITLGDDGGVWRSRDGGNTFEHVKGLPVSQFYHVSIDNQTPYNIYGGLQDNGSWYGPSASIGGIVNGDWNRIGEGDGFRVLAHPTKKITYSEMQGAESIWRYDIDKKSTKNIKPYPQAGDPKLRFNWNTPIALSPNRPDRIYVGSQFVHRSEDRGETWQRISPDLTTNDPKKQQQDKSGGLSTDNSGAENHCTIFTIAESPIDENTIWAGTDDGNIQLSEDGGKSWNNRTPNQTVAPKNTWVYQIEPSRFDKQIAYAALEGHTQNDLTPYAIKTTDGGKTWNRLPMTGVKGFVRHIHEDLKSPNLLFLGTEQGLYISLNGGQDWLAFTNNMPPVAVHYMAQDPITNDLILATHGRGVIILDDVSPLRSITATVLQQDATLLPTPVFHFNDETGFGKTADAGEYVGGNPNRDARVVYYLKNRHTFGKMNLEIQDSAGKKLASLPAGKKKGINIVYWDGRMQAPKLAKAKTFARGGFFGPRVLPGTYKVVLTKANQTYNGSIVYQHNPTSGFTLADKQLNHRYSMELYALNEDVAYATYRVDQLIAVCDSLSKQKEFAKTVATIKGKLDNLKSTLVVTTGDNYVGTAPPQLKEKLATLFNEVAGYQGAPSQNEIDNINQLSTQTKKAIAELELILEKDWKPLSKKATDKGLNADPKIKGRAEFLSER